MNGLLRGITSHKNVVTSMIRGGSRDTCTMLLPGWLSVIVGQLFIICFSLSSTTLAILPSSPSLLSSSSSSSSSSSLGSVVGLFRHAVKGLSADALTSVQFQHAHEAFPDDRRFALLYQKNMDKFEAENPNWLHKENFLCAFTAPKLFAQYQATYQLHQTKHIIASSSKQQQQQQRQQLQQPSEGHLDLLSYGLPADRVEMLDATTTSNFGGKEDAAVIHRWLTLRERSPTNRVVLGPVDLATSHGREALASFFTIQSGRPLVCVTAQSNQHQQLQQHTHQFGNTSSGVKLRKGDTRTMHIINAATIRDITARTGIPLNPTRFRPNIVIDGAKPWSEFEWIGKRIQMGPFCQMSVLSRTVRCDGVSVDPLDLDRGVLDLPRLLIQHYPQHGPYLGVYAALDVPGTLSLYDSITPC